MMRIWTLCGLLSFNCVMGFAAQLKNIAASQQANKATLYFSIDGSFTHKLFALQNPNRIVVDLQGTHLAVNVNQLAIKTNLIQHVRSGKPDSKTLRLVFDVAQKVHVNSSPWRAKNSSNGIRVTIIGDGKQTADVAAHPVPTSRGAGTMSRPERSSAAFSAPLKIKENHLPAAIKANAVTLSKVQVKSQPSYRAQPPVSRHKSPIQVKNSPSRRLRDVIVVLDAGHGGKDPGARGPRRSREKDVVLAITLKLKQLIDRQPGMKAVLTRSGDYYVGLRQRLDIARKYNGDIFVSIHADAFNNPHSNGASVFALSQSGATSEAARWIAEKENYSELGGVNLGDLDDQNGVVRSVLIDLSQTATINAGLQMGTKVLRQLDSFTRLHNNKVEQARFMVLKSPDIPSILVETGFISNPREERNLTSSSYQSRLSQAIFYGIKGYFSENPPQGTRLEAMSSNNMHLVRAGETLPRIAAHYHVSVSALQKMNNLQGQTARPGQQLVIPSAWS